MQGNGSRSIRSIGRSVVIVLAGVLALAAASASVASAKYSKGLIKPSLREALDGAYSGSSTYSGSWKKSNSGSSTTSTEASAPGCQAPSTYQAFSSFGDQGWYYLAPGGDFEQSGWVSAGTTALVNETDPFNLTASADSRSLRLHEDATVRTPKLCVTDEMPHLRFVAKAARGGGQLDVEVRLYGPDGRVTDSSSGSVSPSDHAGWSPSRRVDLKTDALDPGASGYVDIVFRSQGDWLIDDVLIDPYRRR